MDLKGYEILGIIRFTSNSEGKLQEYTTQKFIKAIGEDQTGIKIVELGDENEILKTIGGTQIGPDELKKLNENYGIKTLMTGILDLSKPSTDVDIFGGLTNLSVEQKVTATLTVKLRDTQSGATIWTNSATFSREVSDVGFYGGFFHFDSEDPDKAYGKLVDKLVRDVSEDFRVTWE
jgi:hypothetical protein